MKALSLIMYNDSHLSNMSLHNLSHIITNIYIYVQIKALTFRRTQMV